MLAADEKRLGRPRKTLEQRVCEGYFLARQHERLLACSPPLPWPRLALLQRSYRNARSEPERRAIALNFERLLNQAHAKLPVGSSFRTGPSLDEELAALGPAGSFEQVVKFFPRFLFHYQTSRMAGTPFTLAPFQRDFLA